MISSPPMTVGLAIISDRASQHSDYDRSGPAVKQWLNQHSQSFQLSQFTIIPDSPDHLQSLISTWTDSLNLNLIITSGGTGLSPTDKTSETIRRLLDKECTGLSTLILMKSLELTQFAALSSPVVGVRGRTLIMTLPGSPKACLENLEIVRGVLRHAVQLCSSPVHQQSSITHPPLLSQGQHTPSSGPSSARLASGKHGCMCDRDDTVTANTVADRPRQSQYQMVEVEKAWTILFNEAQNNIMPKQLISTSDAVHLSGHVIADPVYSKLNVPMYNVSFVDGYAIIAPSSPGEYQVSQCISVAGGPVDIKSLELDKQTVVRVNTGSLLPANANAVVMVEDTIIPVDGLDKHTGNETTVLIQSDSMPGQNVRQAGSDLTQGQLLFEEGHRLSNDGSDIAILVSAGVHQISVYRKVRVALISTGDEVCDLSAGSIGDNQIYDSNRPALSQILSAEHVEIIDFGIVKDERPLILEKLKQALDKCDVVITSGGVSMGERDFIKPILTEDLKATIYFGRVHMKPGKPTTFASVRMNGKPKFIFGLAGNPVSTQVCAHIFVVPFLQCLMGVPWSDGLPVKRNVRVSHDIKLDGRPEFMRVSVDLQEVESYGRILYEYVARSTGAQTSSRVMSMKNFDALLILPAAVEGKSIIKANSQVQAFLFKLL